MQADPYALSRFDKDLVSTGEKLRDQHGDKFHQLVQIATSIVPRTTLYCNRLELIKPISQGTRHIQIIHCCTDGCAQCLGGHWICFYYDGESFFIYDSLNLKSLYPNAENFLRALCPFFDDVCIFFPTVQHQANGKDCGPHAIAMATSVIFGEDPSSIDYSRQDLRKHLLVVYDRNVLMPFPREKTGLMRDSIHICPAPRLQWDMFPGNLQRYPPIAIYTEFRRQNIPFYVRGLPNPDAVSCYANASLQSLLHCEQVRRSFQCQTESNALSKAMKDYRSHSHVHVEQLRGFAGEMYVCREQQDVGEFLSSLFSKSYNLSSLFEHEVVTTRRCLLCGDESPKDSMISYILLAALPPSFRNRDLQTIIDYNLGNWIETDIECRKKLSPKEKMSLKYDEEGRCLGKKVEKMNLSTKNDVIMLQLQLFRLDNRGNVTKIDNLLLQNLSDKCVNIHGDLYRIESVILHHGPTIYQGHYTNILRGINSWIRVDDTHLHHSTVFKCPGGNPYVIILSKINHLSPASLIQVTESSIDDRMKRPCQPLLSQKCNTEKNGGKQNISTSLMNHTKTIMGHVDLTLKQNNHSTNLTHSQLQKMMPSSHQSTAECKPLNNTSGIQKSLPKPYISAYQRFAHDQNKVSNCSLIDQSNKTAIPVRTAQHPILLSTQNHINTQNHVLKRDSYIHIAPIDRRCAVEKPNLPFTNRHQTSFKDTIIIPRHTVTGGIQKAVIKSNAPPIIAGMNAPRIQKKSSLQKFLFPTAEVRKIDQPETSAKIDEIGACSRKNGTKIPSAIGNPHIASVNRKRKGFLDNSNNDHDCMSANSYKVKKFDHSSIMPAYSDVIPILSTKNPFRALVSHGSESVGVRRNSDINHIASDEYSTTSTNRASDNVSCETESNSAIINIVNRDDLIISNSVTHPNRIERKKISQRQYYLKNREKIRERRKIHYQQNRDTILAKSRRSGVTRELDDVIGSQSNTETTISTISNPSEIQSQNIKGRMVDKAMIIAANEIVKKYRLVRRSMIKATKHYVVDESSVRKATRRFPIDHKKTTDVLLKSKERYIDIVMENLGPCGSIEGRIQADRLITRCIHVRNDKILRLKRTLKKLRNKCEVAVSKLGEVPILDNLEFSISVLCGKPGHHSTTEPYFFETAYDPKNLRPWTETDIDGTSSEVKNDPFIINENGELTNILPVLVRPRKSKSAWVCHDYCRRIDVDILREVKQLFSELIILDYRSDKDLFTHIDLCTSETRTNSKRGHPITCYAEPLSCKSKFLKLNILSYHYPFLRTLKRLIYEIKYLYEQIEIIDVALQEGNSIQLQRIQKESEMIQVKCKTNESETCLDESELTKRYMKGIEEFTKIDRDPPSIPCVSCERLCTSRYVDKVEKHAIENGSKYFALKGTTSMFLLGGCEEENIEKNWWEVLQDLYDPEYFRNGFICHHCIGKFKKNQLPSLCILNNLSIDETPPEIQTLNRFEKMLVQRAKAFQVVVKLETVQKKNIPHYMKLDQVKGRTFHLPLPMEATLEKVCKETDPINPNHEMFILVRSNPTKKKVIWEDYVDMKKVWIALQWLKANNPLYANIQLPDEPEKLLKYLEQNDLEYDEGLQDQPQNGAEGMLENGSHAIQPDSENIIDDVENDSNRGVVIDRESDNLRSEVNRNVETIPILPPNIAAGNDGAISSTNENSNSNGHHIDKEFNGDVNVDTDAVAPPLPAKEPALLTLKSQSDPYYEDFTIYPLHTKSVNEKDATMYQMLQVFAKALDNRARDLDLKCFPDLFPRGRYGQYEIRDIKLRDSDYYKSRLISKHNQFRLNIPYLFHALHNHNMRQVSAGIFHKLNVVNPHLQYTAQELLNLMGSEIFEQNIGTIFSRLRGTEAYWTQVRMELNCMAREYGPMTFFITFSPSEWMWSDMAKYICKVNGWDEQNHNISELIARDPISASRYIENKFKAVLAYINSEAQPIGKVRHHHFTREYQGRGIPHFHCFFWIEGAPVYGISSEAEIQAFILRYLTCRIPPVSSPELRRKVLANQLHKHNDYCMRKKKTSVGFKCVCRFCFPRIVTDTLILRSVALAIANRKKLRNNSRFYDLPRSEEERYINDYIAALLLVWDGNMDAQLIAEDSYLLTGYVTGYGTKGEKSHIDLSDMKSNQTLYSRLWSMATRALQYRSCGSIEAADTLLGHPLHATDRKTVFRWLDVRVIRNRKLKPYQVVKSLEPDSTDIFYDSFIDTHYPQRPVELDAMCLYDFARWFDIQKDKPKCREEKNGETMFYEMNNGYYCKRRSNPYLINHYRNNPDTQPEAYFHAILLLFQPWRDVNEILGNEKNYADAFYTRQSELEDAMKYHEKLQTIESAKKRVEELIEAELFAAEDKLVSQNIPDDCVPIEAEGAMKDFDDNLKNIILDENHLNESVSKFNCDQRRVFDEVTRTFGTPNKILRLFVSGSGGTGKSFLISTLVLWMKLKRQKDTAVAAPTGIAAYNINGLTLHRLLQLQVERDRTPKYKELSAAALKKMRQTFEDVDLIIIDEISMVSNLTLLYVHLRLTQIFGTGDDPDGWFGKKHMVVFGDLLQLPPVNEPFPFIEVSKTVLDDCVKAMDAFNLWTLFSYQELTINERQKGDESYNEILKRIRLGVVTDTDIATLNQRRIPLVCDHYPAVVQELCTYIDALPADTVCLLPSRHMCHILNDAMLKNIESEPIKLVAIDSYKCPKKSEKTIKSILEDDDKSECGIDRIITLKISSKIMIRRNIDVSIGLVNGTIARVVKFDRDKDDVVTRVRIQLGSGIEYSLERFEYKFIVSDRIFIVRKQFPITLSYGITIHKSQGLSLKNAVVDVGSGIFSPGQTYVALSRVTRLDGLHLINFNPCKIEADDRAILEYNRLRRLYRPDIEPYGVPKGIDCANMVNDIRWAPSKNVLAVQEKQTTDYVNSVELRGLPNRDNVSCYANSIVHGLFHLETVRKVLIHQNNSNILKVIFHQYRAKTDVHVTALRRFTGEEYVTTVQQDAVDFLSNLCRKSVILDQIIGYRWSSVVRCRSESCKDRTESELRCDHILQLTLPENRDSFKLQELIDIYVERWREIGDMCHCKRRKIESIHLELPKPIIILKLPVFNLQSGQMVKMRDVKVNEVYKGKISILGKNYNVVSAIFLFEDKGSNRARHYVNIVRDGNHWFEITDDVVRKRSWPKSSKDIYILFLERT